MKYYKQLSEYNTFTLNDATKIIGNETNAKKYLDNMIKKDIIHRIKRNLYTCYNFAMNSDCADRFEIGSNLSDNSFISYHSAFEFYGYYNQSYSVIQTSSFNRIKPFNYNGYNYINYLTNSIVQVDTIKGVRVTSIERTIVDSINMLDKVIDFEELNNCLDLIHNVNESKIIEVLDAYNKEILYKKVGLILSYHNDDFGLSDDFYDICKRKGIVSNIGTVSNINKNDLVFNSEWGIYTYKNFDKTDSLSRY